MPDIPMTALERPSPADDEPTTPMFGDGTAHISRELLLEDRNLRAAWALFDSLHRKAEDEHVRWLAAEERVQLLVSQVEAMESRCQELCEEAQMDDPEGIFQISRTSSRASLPSHQSSGCTTATEDGRHRCRHVLELREHNARTYQRWLREIGADIMSREELEREAAGLTRSLPARRGGSASRAESPAASDSTPPLMLMRARMSNPGLQRPSSSLMSRARDEAAVAVARDIGAAAGSSRTKRPVAAGHMQSQRSMSSVGSARELPRPPWF
eukprot:gnl/TRDRNA2_/TRDRNA2_39097_c0_seq1.p1 gnl/TRDRNA2_/TRDRNA2_39097_c0~~gnl/TRDRNA2_/TRDRNA2_39097_c0_seq1.p1  ORF type:complete len:270 (-),score=39.28 gnl/TRDRNA2_/TRDRNA2_39097_c0_seq1:73-882(-)